MVVVVGVVLLIPLLLLACRPVAVPYLQSLLPPSPAAGAAAAAAAVKVHSHWLQPAPCIAVLVAGSWWHSCVAHSRGGNQERSEYRERRRTSMNSAPVQEGGSCEFASLVRKFVPSLGSLLYARKEDRACEQVFLFPFLFYLPDFKE